MQVDLQPIAKNPDALLTYIDINFRRMADTLALLTNAEQGFAEVTGSLQIDTGMAEVLNVFAGFVDDPVSGAAFISAFPIGVYAPRVVELRVFTSSFAASTTPTTVSWYALGV